MLGLFIIIIVKNPEAAAPLWSSPRRGRTRVTAASTEGLCPDWQSWDPNKPVDNAREAMQQADDWLGVPPVIAPEELVDPNVDEHSVMTYLSQFSKAKLKPGAPPPAQDRPQQREGLRARCAAATHTRRTAW
ncbi:unnamed protein product [Lampetra fluviatilis]